MKYSFIFCRFTIFAAAILIACNIFSLRELFLLPDGKLHVHFLSVGQGDATLIITPSGSRVLVDGGPELSVLEYIGDELPFFDRTIDSIILTHPDLDHLASLPEVLLRYHVSNVIMPSVDRSLPRYQDFLNEIREQNISVIFGASDLFLDLDNAVSLHTLWPPVSASDLSTNGSSLIQMLEFKSHKILFTGDADLQAENSLLASGADINADVLKVPHHGSLSASSTGFLLSVNPTSAIVSAGLNNPHSHPHPIVLERLKSLGIAVRNTAVQGTISMTFR